MRSLLSVLMLGAVVTACTDMPTSSPTAKDTQPGPLFSRSAGAVTPGVAPRNSKPLGRTYEEWGGALLQWVAAIPTATNPFLDQTGAFTQAHESGKVWFLMGPSQALAQPQTGAITIPTGTSIFYAPLAAYNPGPGGIAGDGDDTPEEVHSLSQFLLSLITGVTVTIDGVPVADVEQYQVVSPSVVLQVPNDNVFTDVFGEPNPFTFGALGGYGLFINPLQPGVHTLHAVSAVPAFGLAFDMTYTITVKAGR